MLYYVILFFCLSFDFTLTVCKHDDVELNWKLKAKSWKSCKKLHEVHNKTWEEISVSLLQTSIDVGLPGLRATLASLWFAAAEVFLQRLPVSFLSGLHCDRTFPRTSFPGWGSTRVWCTFNLVLLFTGFGYNIKHEHLISDLGNNRKAWNQLHWDMGTLKLSSYLGAAWFCLWWWPQYTADTAISPVELFWGVGQHSPDDRPGGRCHSRPTSPQCYTLHTNFRSPLPPPPPTPQPAPPHYKQKIIGIRSLNTKSSSKI